MGALPCSLCQKNGRWELHFPTGAVVTNCVAVWRQGREQVNSGGGIETGAAEMLSRQTSRMPEQDVHVAGKGTAA